MPEFQEFPKMLYKDGATKVVKSQEEQSQCSSEGWSDQPPSPEEQKPAAGDDAPLNADPLREPRIVSQIEQEKTRLAGNQGAVDPATVDTEPIEGDDPGLSERTEAKLDTFNNDPEAQKKSASKKGK